MKPICVKCQRFYQPKKIGYFFLEGMPKFNGAKPGINYNNDWDNYKLWVGDLWECLGCNHQIIVGAGTAPISEYYMPNFDESLKSYQPKIRINDC